MDKQAVLNVLNNLAVVEQQGGEDCYILVKNNEETRRKLNDLGVTDEDIKAAGDAETFCILTLAFNKDLADTFKNGKLVLWQPIDDELRDRVSNGEGTSEDAERLLAALQTWCLGPARALGAAD
ncbi:MAG: hypothetical protein ACE3L7_04060 [Candidatus Pristimantibacillus sp.]